MNYELVSHQSLLIVDAGFARYYPDTVFEFGGAGLVGDDAGASAGTLQILALAGVEEVVGGHHEGELVHVGVIDYHESALRAFWGEDKERVAEFEVGAVARERTFGVGARKEDWFRRGRLL